MLIFSLLMGRGLGKKLAALGYSGPDVFDAQNEGTFRNLIVWLEDTKIRHYKIDERAPLRDVNSDGWTTTFSKYLDDIACPRKSLELRDRMVQLEWLLTFAVTLEYSENVEGYGAPQDEPAPSSLRDSAVDRLQPI